MLIGPDTLSLSCREAYYTLSGLDAFRVARGSVDVFVVVHSQEGRLERRALVIRVSAGSSLIIPAFARADDQGEILCFAIVGREEDNALVRTQEGGRARERFLLASGIRGAAYADFGECLLAYHEACTGEEEPPEAIVLDAQSPFMADDPDESYYVESGTAYVYLTPTAESGMNERREFLCHATPQDDFAIPGMMYASGGRIWRLSIAAENGTARLGRMRCTRTAKEKFLSAIQQQSGGQAGGDELPGMYAHEGFEESLVQLYVKRNELADTIREKRQEKHRADIARDVHDAIRSGVSGETLTEPAGDGTALYRTLRYLCAKGGIPLPEEAELRCRCPGMTLPEIARVSNFICREVVLDADWYRCDCGLIIGVLDGRPVACIPWGSGGYRLYDDSVGHEVKLNAKTARQIHPKAYSIRRALPARSLSYGDIVRHVIRGIRGWDVLLTVLLSALCMLISLLLPFLSRKVYDDCMPMGDTAMLLQLCLLVGAFMLGGVFFTLVKKLCELRICARAGYDLQDAMYARMFTLPESLLHRYESGDLAQRVRMFGSLCSRIVNKAVVTGISAVFALLYLFQMVHYARALAAVAVLMAAAYGLLVYAISVRALKYQRAAADSENESCARLYQLLSGIQKIRMAGAEDRAVLEYIKPAAQQQQASIRANRIVSLGHVLRDAGGTLLSMVLVFLLVHNRMVISTGSFIAFSMAFGAMTSAVLEMVSDLMEYRLMKPRLEQLRPLIETAPETDAGLELEHIEKLGGRVSFEHVVFSYTQGGAPVLRDLSFDIRPGEYVALVGPSGCGKSTVLKLLLGFEAPQAGRVLYDGRDLAAIDKHSLRKRLGVVLQSGSLISGSIYDNIVITSENPSLAAAEAAVEKVGLKEDIDAMPMHLNTVINESAGTLSGGQKQRILIARAIAGDPDVLLLDEATSALDNVTQAKVCESLDRMRVTRIVIAHRLSTIKSCDRILVLDNGRIVEEGSYEQLYARRGLFYKMARRQIAGIGEDEEA